MVFSVVGVRTAKKTREVENKAEIVKKGRNFIHIFSLTSFVNTTPAVFSKSSLVNFFLCVREKRRFQRREEKLRRISEKSQKNLREINDKILYRLFHHELPRRAFGND